MSLLPRSSAPVFDPNAGNAVDMRPGAEAAADPVNFVDLLTASFRQENVVGSILARQGSGEADDPTFNPWNDIVGTDYEEQWDRFVDVRSAGQSAARKRQIDMEQQDRNTIASSGGWGMLTTFGAGLFSPENLLPAGSIYRGAKVGEAAAKTAITTALAAGFSAGVSELVLQSTQETRTAADTVVNIAGSVLIGGALGAGLSTLFSKSDFARLGKAVETEAMAGTDLRVQSEAEVEMLSGMGAPASAGAAARPIESIDDLSIAGNAAKVAGGSVKFLNPVLRILHSPSQSTRSIGTAMFENPVYLKKNMQGIASAPAVETLVKQYTQGAMAKAVQSANSLYADYRKAGGALPREQWNEAIGKAMRRADEDADPNIAAAAKAWRSTIFDPLKERAIEIGLLPRDVSVDTALSYFTRVYNRPMIEAREAEFKGIVRRYIDREVRNAQIRAELDDIGALNGAPTGKRPPDFLNDADRAGYVKQIVDDIFNAVTGRNVDGDIPRDIVAATRGPLKERTFHIPDAEIEQFLESNVEAVARRYARTMASDIELTQTFGKADLKEQINGIKADYQKLREAVAKDIDPDTGAELKQKRTPKQKDEQVRKLAAGEKADIRDIQALRDLIRGSYKAGDNSTNFARVARVAGTVNYLRTMGGVTLSSLTDIGRHVMVHGFTNVMRDGLVPMIKNLKGFKMSVEEAKIAGAVTERLLNTRMATWADITDPYSVLSPFERFMDNTATGFSKLNGMVYWNDFQKSFASVITQNRVLRGVGNYTGIDQRERAYLAFLGIDRDMAERIGGQFARHGTTEDGGIRVANTDDWDDEIARRTYRAAVNKDVDSTIVTKGVGDVPLFSHTPTGRLLLQFKSFALASHQRALMRGLQERQMGFVAGSMVAVAAGMMIYWLKSLESNRIEDISDNPGRWIAEGIDRSGMLSIAFEVNNTVEKAFGIGAYGALAAAFPGAEQSGKSSRYSMRSTAAALTGPTGDLIDTAIRAGQAIKGAADGWTEGDINSIRRLIPGATLPGIRSLVEYLGVPAVQEALAN